MATKPMKIDESLVDVFGRISQEFAEKIKKEYGLRELFVHNTTASQLVAAKLNGQKAINFKIRKTGLNTGVLELA